jgi:aldose 1-epimerase
MAAFKANPNQTAIPFMGPWINRLDEQAFYANGKRYAFDMGLGNVRGAIPIPRLCDLEHPNGASFLWTQAAPVQPVTSRLEFSRQPSWMKQWPFAHTIDMTYRLTNGTLEVETAITNLSAEPMPVSVGFHPYFQLTDSPRDEWTISVGARTHLKLTPNKCRPARPRRSPRRSQAACRSAITSWTTASWIWSATNKDAPP